MTDKSNIHSPSRDAATPPISKHADVTLFFTHIEATHSKRKVHYIEKQLSKENENFIEVQQESDSRQRPIAEIENFKS